MSIATEPLTEWLTPDKVGPLVGVSRQSIYKLIERGELRARKIPTLRGYLISRAEVDRFLAAIDAQGGE